MISFGDLLTLLVCFFLVIVEHTPVRAGEHLQTKEGVSSPGPQESKQTFSGTSFASFSSDKQFVKDRTLRRELPLFTDEFSESGEQLSAATTARLRVEIGRLAEVAMIEISTCGDGDWGKSRNRVQELRRIALEEKVDVRRLRFQVTAGCEAMEQYDPVTAQVGAVISFFDKEGTVGGNSRT